MSPLNRSAAIGLLLLGKLWPGEVGAMGYGVDIGISGANVCGRIWGVVEQNMI